VVAYCHRKLVISAGLAYHLKDLEINRFGDQMAEPIDKLAVSCSTCPYFVPADDKGGTCHADPPQAIILMLPPTPLGQPNFQIRSVWRPVAPSEWCGKHPMFGIRSAVPLDHRLAAVAEGTG
jgi:hypothetical protein